MLDNCTAHLLCEMIQHSLMSLMDFFMERNTHYDALQTTQTCLTPDPQSR